MKTILLTFLVMFLVGCANQFSPTEDRELVVLKFVITEDLSWLGLDTPARKIVGYHHCTGTLCTVWLPPHDSSYADCIWAHELKHIKYGLYHKVGEFRC